MSLARAYRPAPGSGVMGMASAAWARIVGLFSAFGASQTAFQSTFTDEYVTADLMDRRKWAYWIARVQRYRLLWAMYEGTAYSSKAHHWAQSWRQQRGIYAWTRSVFGQPFRLGEFWSEHIWGGQIDRDAGNGLETPTAIPIKTDNEGLRKPIAKLFRDSTFQSYKNIVARWGSVMGDVFLTVIDDTANERVYLRPIDAAIVRYVDKDEMGTIRGYVIQEVRPDPLYFETSGLSVPPPVSYTEVCNREDGEIVYRTYRQGEPFDWHVYPPGTPESDRIGPEWRRPYGFVPLVHIQHMDVGFNWGWGEYFPALSRVTEADDLGSILTDQARRILNSPWVIYGRKPPDPLRRRRTPALDEFADPLNPPVQAGSSVSTVTGRDEMQLNWIDPIQVGGRPPSPFQLVGAMPIADIGAQADRILANIEKDYPELQMSGVESGDSGRARRVARQKAEAKVHARRAVYDSGLETAIVMALRMGSQQGYPGYEGIDGEAFDRGDLTVMIDKRPVFAQDPMDEIEEYQAKMTAVLTAKQAGVPIDIPMRDLQFPESDVKKAAQREEDSIKQAQDLATAKAAQQQRSIGGKNPPAKPPGVPRPEVAASPPAPKGETRNQPQDKT
jgi:hypothetical protein